jgi:hypothetical protein
VIRGFFLAAGSLQVSPRKLWDADPDQTCSQARSA